MTRRNRYRGRAASASRTEPEPGRTYYRVVYGTPGRLRQPPLSGLLRALDAGERDHAITMPARVAVRVRVRLTALEEEMQIVLPGEANAAMNLER